MDPEGFTAVIYGGGQNSNTGGYVLPLQNSANACVKIYPEMSPETFTATQFSSEVYTEQGSVDGSGCSDTGEPGLCDGINAASSSTNYSCVNLIPRTHCCVCGGGSVKDENVCIDLVTESASWSYRCGQTD